MRAAGVRPESESSVVCVECALAGMRSFDKLRISARGSNAAPTPQLRLRGEDRFALLTAPLIMTIVSHGPEF
jgi:hypothetical protein